jgi:hypothetical protein
MLVQENTGYYDRRAGGAGTRAVSAVKGTCEQTAALIGAHPLSSAVATFACGCTLGVLTGLLLQPRPPRRTGLSSFASSDWLHAAVERVLPEALSRYLNR